MMKSKVYDIPWAVLHTTEGINFRLDEEEIKMESPYELAQGEMLEGEESAHVFFEIDFYDKDDSECKMDIAFTISFECLPGREYQLKIRQLNVWIDEAGKAAHKPSYFLESGSAKASLLEYFVDEINELINI